MRLNILNVRNVGINGRNEYLDILEKAWRQHLAPKGPDAPTVVSLFAGCEGSSLGYSMAGFRELLAVEWDDKAVATFKLNFPDVPIYHGDIHKLTVEHCLELAGLQLGELDLLDGSPPCQGFSMAGKRKLADMRNQLYNEFARILEGMRPKTFVMENVPGMVKGKMKLVFADCTKKLKAAGYRVSCRMLDAKWFNVPQERKRLIWVGIREDLTAKPSYPPAQRRPFSVREALGDLLPGVAGQASPFERKDFIRACENDMHSDEWRDADLPSATVTANRPPVILLDDERKRGHSIDRPAYTVGAERRSVLTIATPTPGGGFFRDADEPARTLTGASRPYLDEKHSPEVLEAWRENRRYVGSFHSARLDDGKPSPTQIGTYRNWHWGAARQLTDRECARLQSFPDEFRFTGNKTQIQRQIGNSVPPLFMRAIASHIRQEILQQ